MNSRPFRASGHPVFETLSAYSSGELSPRERASVERHLSVCTECTGQLADLDRLLADARRLPAAIEPPAGLWEDVRAAIGAVPVARERRFSARSLFRSPAFLAAAALLLVASSSAVTAIVMRERSVAADTRETTPTHPVSIPVGVPVALPAALARVDAEYARTAEQLAVVLASRRARLAPHTVETLERSLRTIDTAIAEARRALAQDPGNRALVDIFSANYQQKLDLMKRVTELSSSI